MIVYPPIEITPARFLSSSIDEPDTALGEVEWVSGTAYAKGDEVVLVATHKKYRALIEIESGDLTVPSSDPLKWQDIGATNRWAMFDAGRSNTTIGEPGEPIIVRISPGKRVDSLALVGLAASRVIIRVFQDGDLEYEREINLTRRTVMNWFDYFFNDFTYQEDAIFSNLPMYANAEIEVEVSYGDIAPEVKALVVCRSVDLGATIIDPTLTGTNYSRIVRDQEFGNVGRVVERRFVPTTRQKVLINQSANADLIRQTLIDIRSTPALFSAMDDNTDNPWFSSFLIYGLLKDWSLTASGKCHGSLTIDLEEL